MKEKSYEYPKDFTECAEFHGHICPGLSIGYKAAKAGLRRLKERRSEDEEIVAIVENNACGVDAVQVLTGCTFGKGNFFFKDYGKQVFTFISRNSSKGVRVSFNKKNLQFNSQAENEEYCALRSKLSSDTMSGTEKKKFWELHHKKSRQILESEESCLFSIREGYFNVPEKAKIEESISCDVCGESVMKSRLIEQNDKKKCMDCITVH